MSHPVLRISFALTLCLLPLGCVRCARQNAEHGVGAPEDGATSARIDAGGSVQDRLAPRRVEASEGLGSSQCAFTNGLCEDGCHPIWARRLDEGRKCLEPREIVACSTQSIFPEEFCCRVHVASGAVYGVSVLALEEPGFIGWRACNESERARLQEAEPRACVR